MKHKRLSSLVLALVVAVSVTPAEFLYAEEDGADGFVLTAEEAAGENENGTETEFKEGEIEEVVVFSDQETAEDLNDTAAGEEAGLLLTDDYIDFEPEEDAWIPEDGILEEEEEEETEQEIVLEAAESAAVSDQKAGQEKTAGPAADTGGPYLSGGNVEHLNIQELFEHMGVYASAPGADPNGLLSAADSINYKYKGNIPAGYHSITITQSGSTVTVKGSVKAPWTLYYLYVDGYEAATLSGQSLSKTINLNNYGTGYHTVSLGVVNETQQLVDIIGKRFLSCNTITARPGYNGVFEVYSNYFNYYPYDMAGNNAAGQLFMEYSPNGGKSWLRSGYMTRNSIKLYIQQAYRIGGLKANTKYLTRIRYGTYVTYPTGVGGDGKSYFFGGPVRNTTTIKTGDSKKLQVKSITAKSINIKYHKIRHAGYYNYVGGSLFWHSAYTEKFYTCKIKVTVKLKKKPGTAGIWINGKWVSGNKKTYTATFTPYPNYYAKRPKGRYKFKVTICSGQNKSWGGYSPSASKNKKLT